MQNKLQIYATDGLIIHDNQQENVVLLIHTHNPEIAEKHIQIYAQKNQLRLTHLFHPLPFDLYSQRHANPILSQR
ncbi:hypothetical protein [Avibacterium volantium]|uniref:hypothetical protein n=1 Tax=Avibacterium volantium TaxID=762 RepID=UPI003BF863B1